MNERNKKTFTIIALAVAILLIGVGYAFLQQNLVINGAANISGARWDVKITNIQEKNLVGATLTELADDVTNPSYTDTSATFEVDLAYPGAYAEFDVTITNGGTIDAVLNSITNLNTINNTDPKEIQYSITGVVEGETELPAGETGNTNVATVRVEWLSDSQGGDTVPTVGRKTATITLNYIQDTGSTSNTETPDGE